MTPPVAMHPAGPGQRQVATRLARSRRCAASANRSWPPTGSPFNARWSPATNQSAGKILYADAGLCWHQSASPHILPPAHFPFTRSMP